MKNDEFSNRLLELAVRALKLSEKLNESYAHRHIGKQLVRSGTAIGANYEEARGAESRGDFIHKMRISLKEARETLYWLRIILKLEHFPAERLEPIILETDEVCSILVSSLKTMDNKKS